MVAAQDSEQKAATSEANAKASEQASKLSEINASSSEANSLSYKNSASTSAINASTSASNASKSEVAAKSAQAEAERARDEANSALAKISGALKYMGQVDNYNDLPSTGNSKGDTWNVVNADPSHHIKAGDNVAWNGTEWDDLSGVVDLSAYAEKADYQKAITSATADGATITFNHKDGTTSTTTVNNVASATAATNDAKGQKIDTTYEKIADASNVHTSLQNSINGLSTGKQDKLTFDTAPTAGSSNPVTSAGIKAAIDAKTVDLSNYYTKEQIGKSVLSVVANNDTLTFIHRDATKDSLTINNVGHATKASQDGNGNNIVTTYETKASHASDINSINNTINTKCLSSLTVTDASITATTVDGTKSTVTVNNVVHATKASQDDKGQAIDTTYATKLEVKSKENNIMRSFAALPVCYMRDSCFGGAKTTLTAPSHLYVNVGNLGFIQESSSTIDISKTAAWDNSIYATAANRKGKDFYIYACQSDTSVPKIILSANSTVPTGYTATNSRKVGGFHCECADVGTISGHPLSGYVAGDIMPGSVWD